MKFTSDLAERIAKLLYNDKTSDVTFVVDGERVPAHRAILSISSDYFRALLHGNMKESLQDEIVLKDVGLNGFRQLMSYIYTGQLTLEGADEETILEFLDVSHLYGFQELQIPISHHLLDFLSIQNVPKILSGILHLDLGFLEDACYRVLEDNASEILESEHLIHMSANALRQVLSRDTFCAEEIDIFKAVERWCAERPEDEDEFPKILEMIRLPLMDTKNLVTVVMDSGLLTEDRLLEAIREKECSSTELKHRGNLICDENLAPSFHVLSFTETTGRNWRYCELDMPCLINHVSFELLSSVSCSLIVEVSMNFKDWFPVYAHSKDSCLIPTKIYFEPRVARYVSIELLDFSDTVLVRAMGVFYKSNPGASSHGGYTTA